MNDESLKEVRELADRHCAGLLSDQEAQRLNELLHDNPAAQRLFLEVTSIYARLQWEFAGTKGRDSQTDVFQLPLPEVPQPIFFWGRWRKTILAASLFVICSIIGLLAFSWTPRTANVALLKNTAHAVWRTGFAPAGNSLPAGRVCLDEGLAEIEFGCGAVAVLNAPVDVELLQVDKVFLHSGQMLVRVPHDGRAAGFRVETPSSQLVDLGTEFGVEVQGGGASLLQVYEGEVLATTKAKADSSNPRRVLEGQAVRLGSDLHETEFWPERFVRELPGPKDPMGRGKKPYNVSRFDSIYIVPAIEKVTIDGDLMDWDLSRRFYAACESPYAENYYLEAAMMYDERCLYVGAHVGDPHPMRSQIAPEEHANRHGMGGAVALRISTDRQVGWPLSAENTGGRPMTPVDLNDKLSFLVLWYYQPQQKACIHLRHGMDLHGVQVNPEGYEGTFRADPDGRGYTLEYAIPWHLLHAEDDPPQAGDELAALWLTHWSDAEGRNWQGQLIDVMKPNEPGWNFERAATWGKAVYLPMAP